MAFELAPPGAISDYDDLETLANRRQHQILDEFDSLQADYGGVLSAGLDLPKEMNAFGGKLAALLCVNCGEQDRSRHSEIVSTSMKVAALVVDRALAPRGYGMSMKSISEAADDTSALNELIYKGPIDYLKTRPTLIYFLKTYTKPLISTTDDELSVYIAGGLTFAQVEEHRYDTYVDFHMRRLDAELTDLPILGDDLE